MLYCDNGELFGLLPSDLSDSQIEKINTTKLIEFIGIDARVDKILGDRIDSWEIIRQQFGGLQNCSAKHAQYISKKYNEFISCNRLPTSWYNRKNYFFWNLLNEDNKVSECKRWISGKDNIIDISAIDFNWLYSEHPRIAKTMAKNIISEADCGYYSSYSSYFQNLIPCFDELELNKYFHIIYDKGYPYHLYLASNKFTPEIYMERLLRYMAGKKTIPVMKVVMSKNILSKIPPVARLKLLESLVYKTNRINFLDISTSKDLESLLFVTSVKYNSRVKGVISAFNENYEKKLNLGIIAGT